MSPDLMARVQELTRVESSSGMAGALSRTLVEVSEGHWTTKAARDTFTAVLRRVRQGGVQVVGKKLSEQVVIISVEGLAELLKKAADDESVAEALRRRPGFKPVALEVELKQRPRAQTSYRDRLPLTGKRMATSALR